MGAMKTSWILSALALLACLVVLGLRSGEPVAPSVPGTARGPSFEVHVVKPLSARPLFGLLPENLLGLPELRFDQASPGASIGSVAQDHLELSAEDWHLFIEKDDEGRIAPGTHLVFPLELGGRQRKLRCRPAEEAPGYFRTTPEPPSDVLDGLFLVGLATCEDAGTGKILEWPPAPLTVRGSFEGLPLDRR